MKLANRYSLSLCSLFLCFVTPSYAGNNHNWFNTSVNYSIDADTCAVTFTSSKRIKRVVLIDENNHRLARWRGIRSNEFTVPTEYLGVIAENSRFIIGFGRWRGRNAVLGSDLFGELDACLNTPTCPFTFAGQLNENQNLPGSCNYIDESSADVNDHRVSGLLDCNVPNPSVLCSNVVSSDYVGAYRISTSFNCADIMDTSATSPALYPSCDPNTPIVNGSLTSAELAVCVAESECSEFTQ